MQRAVAAVGQHGEVLGIVAACAQFGEQPVGHVVIDLLANQQRGLDHVAIQVIAQRVFDGRLGTARVQRDRPPRVVLGIQIAQQQVGIGHGRLHASAVVAGRSGVRARRLRAALDGVVHAVVGGHRATARAQRHQVHHGHRHQPAVDHRVEVVVLNPTVHHDADVVAGATHVGGHHVAQTDLHGKVFGCTDARDRAGVDGLQCVGGIELRHAARVVDHQHRLVVAVRAQVLFQRRERVVHGRVQVAVDDGRGGAHVFALAPRHLVRQDDRNRAQQV